MKQLIPITIQVLKTCCFAAFFILWLGIIRIGEKTGVAAAFVVVIAVSEALGTV